MLHEDISLPKQLRYYYRAKLTADMADSSQRVKALVVRAEDARILQEMRAMRSVYASLFTLNNSLIGEDPVEERARSEATDAARQLLCKE